MYRIEYFQRINYFFLVFIFFFSNLSRVISFCYIYIIHRYTHSLYYRIYTEKKRFKLIQGRKTTHELEYIYRKNIIYDQVCIITWFEKFFC